MEVIVLLYIMPNSQIVTNLFCNVVSVLTFIPSDFNRMKHLPSIQFSTYEYS